MNESDYEAKKAARRERYHELAAKARKEGNSRINQAKKMAELIPFGQPILVGHHSEGRDRRFRGRIHDNFGKGFALLEKAEHYQRKATTESRAISSDDPAAVKKLKEKLELLEKSQEMMKRGNAIIRKHQKAGYDTQRQALIDAGFNEKTATEMLTPDFCGRVGFPGYALTNNNSEIKRVKDRLAILEKQSARETRETEYNGFTVREDTEENRIMFFFPGKPDTTTRDLLKSRAFKWSPRRGAWVRQWTGNAVYDAREIIKKLQEEEA